MIETLFILFIIFGLIWNSMQRPHNFPPGPTLLPFIGNILVFDYEKPQKCWEYLRQRYGTLTGIIVPKFNLAIASGWHTIKDILLNENFQGRPDVCLLRDRFDGGRYGLIFLDGEEWKAQRRFTIHHFRNLGFGRKSHESVVLEEAQGLADEIEALNGKPVVMEHLFGISAINITWHLLGGQRYNRKDPLLLKLVKDVKESVHNVQILGSPAVMFPFIRYLFPKMTGYTGIRNGCQGILEFIREAVNCHRANPPADQPSNLIDIYLDKMREEKLDPNTSFTMGQLEGVCMDLLAAGSDTSSAVLSFAFLFLCVYPQIQERIYAEISGSIGTNRLPSCEDKPKLVLCEAFLCEVLRYRAPVPTYPPHVATKDTKLEGYNIPQGTILVLNVNSIFIDEEYWGDPQNFRPERFIDEEGKLKKEERVISFGKGKRSCIGETLSKMSSFLIFVTLVQRFSFRFPDGEVPEDTEGVQAFTLAPPEFRVIAAPRVR